MPFVPFPSGTVEAEVRAVVSGIPVENTLGFQRITGAATASLALVLAGAINTWLSAHLAPLQTAGVAYSEVVVNDLTSETGFSVGEPSTVVGSSGDTALPNQVAMSVTLQTASRGRSQRGRVFLFGFGHEQLISEVAWSTATLTAVDSAFSALSAAVFTAGWEMVVLSRISGGVERSLGQATIVETVEARTKVATQRRRLS